MCNVLEEEIWLRINWQHPCGSIVLCDELANLENWTTQDSHSHTTPLVVVWECFGFNLHHSYHTHLPILHYLASSSVTTTYIDYFYTTNHFNLQHQVPFLL